MTNLSDKNHRSSQDSDSLKSLYQDVAALFECGKISPTTFQKLFDATIKQAEIKKATVEVDAASVLKSKAKSRQPKLKKISWKLNLLYAALFVASVCFILVCLPIFYNSSNDTVVSNFLNHPYVHMVIPKEYGYRLGVFYSNLKFKLAMFTRNLAVYWSAQRMIESLRSKGKTTNNDEWCFLADPLHEKNALTVTCSECSGLEDVYYYQPAEEYSFPKDAVLAGFIHVFENSSYEASLDKLQKEVSSHSLTLGLKQYSFISNVSYVKTAEDLGKSNIMSQLMKDMQLNDSHIAWTTDHYSVAHLMMQVFKRPPMLPFSVPVLRNKAIFIDGTNSLDYILPTVKDRFAIYIQGQGSRKLRFIPPEGCIVHCSTHTITTEASDVLIFDSSLWTAYSLPAHNKSSFAYLTHMILESDVLDAEEKEGESKE